MASLYLDGAKLPLQAKLYCDISNIPINGSVDSQRAPLTEQIAGRQLNIHMNR